MVILTVAITVYAVADIARTPKDEMPARLPKAMWLLLVLLLPPLGGLAWIIVSRVTQAEARGGQINRKVWYSDESAIKSPTFRRHRNTPYGYHAPDDDPEFLWSLEKELRSKRSEEEIREAERRMDEALDALKNHNNPDLDTDDLTDESNPTDTTEDNPDDTKKNDGE